MPSLTSQHPPNLPDYKYLPSPTTANPLSSTISATSTIPSSFSLRPALRPALRFSSPLLREKLPTSWSSHQDPNHHVEVRSLRTGHQPAPRPATMTSFSSTVSSVSVPVPVPLPETALFDNIPSSSPSHPDDPRVCANCERTCNADSLLGGCPSSPPPTAAAAGEDFCSAECFWSWRFGRAEAEDAAAAEQERVAAAAETAATKAAAGACAGAALGAVDERRGGPAPGVVDDPGDASVGGGGIAQAVGRAGWGRELEEEWRYRQRGALWYRVAGSERDCGHAMYMFHNQGMNAPSLGVESVNWGRRLV